MGRYFGTLKPEAYNDIKLIRDTAHDLEYYKINDDEKKQFVYDIGAAYGLPYDYLFYDSRKGILYTEDTNDKELIINEGLRIGSLQKVDEYMEKYKHRVAQHINKDRFLGCKVCYAQKLLGILAPFRDELYNNYSIIGFSVIYDGWARGDKIFLKFTDCDKAWDLTNYLHKAMNRPLNETTCVGQELLTILLNPNTAEIFHKWRDIYNVLDEYEAFHDWFFYDEGTFEVTADGIKLIGKWTRDKKHLKLFGYSSPGGKIGFIPCKDIDELKDALDIILTKRRDLS